MGYDEMTALAVRNRLIPTSAPRVLALVADAATEATARMASGWPMDVASALYDVVVPAGIRRRASHTRT